MTAAQPAKAKTKLASAPVPIASTAVRGDGGQGKAAPKHAGALSPAVAHGHISLQGGAVPEGSQAASPAAPPLDDRVYQAQEVLASVPDDGEVLPHLSEEQLRALSDLAAGEVRADSLAALDAALQPDLPEGADPAPSRRPRSRSREPPLRSECARPEHREDRGSCGPRCELGLALPGFTTAERGVP